MGGHASVNDAIYVSIARRSVDVRADAYFASVDHSINENHRIANYPSKLNGFDVRTLTYKLQIQRSRDINSIALSFIVLQSQK